MTNENQENLPVTLESTLPAVTGDSIFTDMARFELAQRVAKALSVSSIVPRDFQGNIGNCLIAQNLAGRMEVDVFMLMQTMHVIHGKPGIEGKLIIALINKSGMFKGPLRFEFGNDRLKCRAVATLPDGTICEGTWVTWLMVEAEGWNKDKPHKSGGGVQKSKWNTMPDLMFQYRAATFFGRIHCPEVLLGMRSNDELDDMVETTPAPIPVHGTSETAEKPDYSTTEKPEVNIIGQGTGPEKPHTPADIGHRTSPEGPPEGVKMDGSKKDLPPDGYMKNSETGTTDEDAPDDPPPAAEPIEAQDFYRKKINSVMALIASPGRIEATADHILRALWTKCDNYKWDIQHPAFLEWKVAQAAGKAPVGAWTGAATDKIGDDPDRVALKRLHATIKEMGLEPGGVQPVMFARFNITSSKDLKLGNVNLVINWLDELVPVKNLVFQLNDAQKIMADSGKKVDLVAMAIEKINTRLNIGNIEHLYQLYNQPVAIEWVIDNMDGWLTEEKPSPEQAPITPTMIPILQNVYNVVCYAADLTGTPKENPLSPQFHDLAAKVQCFILEGFGITEEDLAAGLPDGIGEKFRDHFVKWFEEHDKV